VTKPGEKGLRHRRRADQPWDTRNISPLSGSRGVTRPKSKLKLLISPKVTTTPFCGEQSFTVNSITTGDERRRFLPRSTWTHHAAAIKVTRPHHPAPTSTLAGDCSGRARSCPPATQHRKPRDPQCESDQH
jgi:hypothetical protein